MFRFLFRFTGLVLITLSFLFVVYDGTKSIADQTIYIICEISVNASLAFIEPVSVSRAAWRLRIASWAAASSRTAASRRS